MSRHKAFDLPGHEVRKVLRDVPNQGRTVLLTHYGGVDCVTRIWHSTLRVDHHEVLHQLAAGHCVQTSPLPPDLASDFEGYRVRASLKGFPWLPDVVNVGMLRNGLEPEGRPFISTRWIEGRPLHLCWPSFGRERRKAVLREVLLILNDMHARRVLHGDLKAENLIVSDLGTRLIDLDTLREVPDPFSPVEVSQITALYSSPEQSHERQAYLSSDLYAYGMLVAQLLGECQPRQPGFPPRLEAPWDTVLAACLRENPLERPRTEELLRAVNGERANLESWNGTAADEATVRVPDSICIDATRPAPPLPAIDTAPLPDPPVTPIQYDAFGVAAPVQQTERVEDPIVTPDTPTDSIGEAQHIGGSDADVTVNSGSEQNVTAAAVSMDQDADRPRDGGNPEGNTDQGTGALDPITGLAYNALPAEGTVTDLGPAGPVPPPTSRWIKPKRTRRGRSRMPRMRLPRPRIPRVPGAVATLSRLRGDHWRRNTALSLLALVFVMTIGLARTGWFPHSSTPPDPEIARVLERLKVHKTELASNNRTVLSGIVRDAADLVESQPTAERWGAFALGRVWEQGWQFTGANWDMGKFSEADKLTRQAYEAGPTAEAVVARAILTGAACRLLPATYDGRTSYCRESVERSDEAFRRIGDGWLMVEARWNAVLVEGLDPNDQARSHGLAAQNCEAAREVLIQAPINGVEMAEDCALVAARSGDMTAWLWWTRWMMKHGERAGKDPEAMRGHIFRSAHPSCSARAARRLDSPFGGKGADALAYCGYMTEMALGCPERAARHICSEDEGDGCVLPPPTDSVPWDMAGMVREQSERLACNRLQ